MLISPQNKTATRNKDLAQPARNTRCLPAPDRYRSKKKKDDNQEASHKIAKENKIRLETPKFAYMLFHHLNSIGASPTQRFFFFSKYVHVWLAED